MVSIVPMQAINNHSFRVVIPFEDKNIEVTIRMTYNEIAGFWFVNLSQNGVDLLTSYPLIPAQDLLEQFQYLGLGHMGIVPKTEVDEQFPSYKSLTTDWVVLWGDF